MLGKFEDWCIDPDRRREGPLGCLIGAESLGKAHACRVQRRRPWSTFSGMKYTEALRLMQHPLAQGILGERISSRAVISALTEHPVLSESVWDTDISGDDVQTEERVTHLGETGLWDADERPLQCTSEDDYLAVVLTAEVLRMFAPTSQPHEDAHSYNLKHTVEEFLGEHVGEFSYVANGTAIWAAAALGIPVAESTPGEYNRNANFGLESLQVEYARRMRRNVRDSGIEIRAHHHRPPGYLFLLRALERYRETGVAPARWDGIDHDAAPLTSPFHEWLVAQASRSERGNPGSRESLAYDYRAGINDGDHGVALEPEDLVRILGELAADEAYLDAARDAMLDWARTSPESTGIRTELIDRSRREHSGWGAGAGDVELYEYKCPCGEGRIVAEHDNIPGFREHDVWISCDRCVAEWRFVPGLPLRRWRLEPISAASPA